MFFNKSLLNYRISNLNQKIIYFKNFNIDFLIVKKFNLQFSRIKALTFIKEIIYKKLEAKYFWKKTLDLDETDEKMRINIHIKLLKGIPSS